ncbi:ABC transporter ATP-binding protein [Corynebacterium heidelbergense]|uniref:ABC transporter ATP-binding protein n=1 Tax=Corynebacterium heidelbergense TaxID=2055947 RepID=A0A364V3X8_9CORY|nr:ABC transporter ATP-binding protein [Corynebacterium heidelbergense]RAV31337.1 ABC transporter ATP-binding protein [Corynebacterium heidelbergense]
MTLQPLAVTVDGAQVAVDGATIVANASFAAQPGDFVALVGPNGCGKTTLLSTLYRARKLSGGQIRVGGQDLAGLSIRNSARLVAALPQSETHELNFRAEEVVSFGRRAHPTDRDDELITEAMELAGVRHLREAPILSVSGGERQRILLARAIAQHTPVLVLDEPTNHLDLSHQAKLLRTLSTLKRSRTVLAAVHDVNLAMHADLVVVMVDGTVRCSGPPSEVLTPQLVQEVYGVQAAAVQHPITGRQVLLFG